jgi:hypothetical protein
MGGNYTGELKKKDPIGRVHEGLTLKLSAGSLLAGGPLCKDIVTA